MADGGAEEVLETLDRSGSSGGPALAVGLAGAVQQSMGVSLGERRRHPQCGRCLSHTVNTVQRILAQNVDQITLTPFLRGLSPCQLPTSTNWQLASSTSLESERKPHRPSRGFAGCHSFPHAPYYSN